MTKEKLLITGADGQLGSGIQEIFSNSDYDLIPLDKLGLDITSQDQIQAVLKKHRPSIIINCAAYNKVEDAEEEIAEAFLQNAFGPYWLSKESKSIGAIFVHISTDYVFDGVVGKYTETDPPNPLNVYGESKLAGERLVLMVNPNSYIIRTSWLFGPSLKDKSRNFVMTMLSRAKENFEIRVVNDQQGSPTYAPDLAIKIRELLEKNAPVGIYHITNSGSCAWYDFAKKIFELAHSDVKVSSITTRESGTKIQRPKSSILENKKLKDLNILILRHWSDALSEYINRIIN
jgi:dTDP-4-dehydrorhamnose reductase